MNLWAFKPLLFGYFTEGSDYFLTEFEAMVLLLVRYGITDFCDTKGLARQPGLFEVSPKQRITYTHRPMQIRMGTWKCKNGVGGSILPTFPVFFPAFKKEQNGNNFEQNTTTNTELYANTVYS